MWWPGRPRRVMVFHLYCRIGPARCASISSGYLRLNSESLAWAAYFYARAGIPVHPLQPGSKVPATKHGVDDASTDMRLVRDFWRDHPDHNIGVACGVLFDVLTSTSKTDQLILLPPPASPADHLHLTYLSFSPLLSWRGGWMRWYDSHWVEIEEAELRSSVLKRLEHAEYVTKDKEGNEKIMPWAPNKHKVADVVDAIRAICLLPETVTAPAWLDYGYHFPAAEIVATASGLLHVGTRELQPLTPLYFNLVSVPFAYDLYAPDPTRWLAFLHQLWPDDPEAIQAIQDWFGYVISGRTDLQKILLMIGPIRSGKGSIARVLEALLGGRGNVAGSTMASLATNFGLEPLVGKLLCVISDARLSSQNAPQALERLLSISGGRPDDG